MRKRYQKVERPKYRQDIDQQDAHRKKLEEGYQDQDDDDSDQSQYVSSNLSSPDVNRLFIAPKTKAQENNRKLLRFMLGTTALLLLLNMSLNNDFTSVVDDTADNMKVLFVVFWVMVPVIVLMRFLRKFLPMKVVVWIGALIVMGMAFSFVGYVVSNWGF